MLHLAKLFYFNTEHIHNYCYIEDILLDKLHIFSFVYLNNNLDHIINNYCYLHHIEHTLTTNMNTNKHKYSVTYSVRILIGRLHTQFDSNILNMRNYNNLLLMCILYNYLGLFDIINI